jgi:hypothetical protein
MIVFILLIIIYVINFVFLINIYTNSFSDELKVLKNTAKIMYSDKFPTSPRSVQLNKNIITIYDIDGNIEEPVYKINNAIILKPGSNTYNLSPLKLEFETKENITLLFKNEKDKTEWKKYIESYNKHDCHCPLNMNLFIYSGVILVLIACSMFLQIPIKYPTLLMLLSVPIISIHHLKFIYMCQCLPLYVLKLSFSYGIACALTIGYIIYAQYTGYTWYATLIQ